LPPYCKITTFAVSKTNMMKRFITIMAVLLCTVTFASAQVKMRDYFPSLGAQAGFKYVHQNDTTKQFYPMVGLHTDFYLSGSFRARVLANVAWHSPSGTNDSFKLMVGATADGHLLINIADALDFYPLLGVTTAFHPLVGNWFSLGLEGGLGIEYNFNDVIGVFAETKYQKLWISPMKGFETYSGFTYTF